MTYRGGPQGEPLNTPSPLSSLAAAERPDPAEDVVPEPVALRGWLGLVA